MDSLLPAPPQDALSPAPTRSVSRVFFVALAAGSIAAYGGLTIGSSLAKIPPGMLDAAPSGWIMTPLLVIALFSVLLLHELGHLLGGFSQGFRFILLVVGPLRLERDQQRNRVRLSRNRDLELAGGVVACMPTTDDDLVRRMSIMVAAGPATSLLIGALAIIAVVTLPLSWWSIAVSLFGVSSLMIGLVTAIPMNNGSFVSDGKRFVQLRADGPAARRDVALLTLTLQDQIGASIESQPVSRLRDALEPADGSMQELVARVHAYTWLVAHQRVAEAQRQLRRGVALSAGKPFNLAAMLVSEQAFAMAWFDGDAVGARTLVKAHEKSWHLLPESERLRTEAAIAIAGGDVGMARAHITRARHLLTAAGAKPAGTAQWTLHRLAEMEQRLGA